MRDNQPVTQREFDYPDDATLLSVTDTQSRIANQLALSASAIAIRAGSAQEQDRCSWPDTGESPINSFVREIR